MVCLTSPRSFGGWAWADFSSFVGVYRTDADYVG